MIKSEIMKQFGNIEAGISSKEYSDLQDFYDKNELDINQRTRVQQIHSDIVLEAKNSGKIGDGDAIWTTEKNIILEIRVADCVPILICAQNGDKKLVAAVHSGWKGTEKNIIGKTIKLILNELGENTEFFLRIGPGISAENYEFGSEIFDFFEEKYILEKEGKYFLDLRAKIMDQILDFGISENNIENYNLCTLGNEEIFHSRRRDQTEKRMFAIICMR